MPSNLNKKIKPPSQLNDAFYKKLVEVSKKINIKPEDLLLVMYIESGLNPGAKNPSGSAAGLTQIMPFVLPSIGFSGTPQEFSKLPAEKQLDYIEKYFIKNLKDKGITDPAQIYLSNFLPATLNWKGVKEKNENAILAEKGNMSTYANKALNSLKKRALNFDQVYQANKGLDLDKDGNISYGDIKRLVEIKRKDPVYQAAVARMKEVSNLPEETEENNESNVFMSYINELIDEIKKSLGSNNLDQFIVKSSLFNKLPNQNILIKINSKKLEDNLELARILSEACEETLLSNCETYTNKKEAEVLCKIPGNLKHCHAAVNELAIIITNKFNEIISPDEIKIQVFANKKPSYKCLDIKTAESNFRKFKFKLIGKKNG